jgi:peptide/nickel transport system substrate-binding protein
MSRRFLTGLVSVGLLFILALGVTTAQDDRPIVVNWWSEPSNIDIHSFGTDGDSDVRFAVYAPLIRRAQVEGPYPNTTIAVAGEYEGALAESWDVDDEAGAVTFHLREGALFASGNPVRAEDVRWTVERGLLSPTSYMFLLMPLGGITDAAQVEVVDDQTVRFVTEGGVTPLFFELLSIVNMSVLDKETILEHATEEDPYATEWLPLNAASSGPYVLTRAEPGVEFVLDPNANYFDADYPRNSGIIFKVIPTAADRLLLLRSGELDVLRGVPYSEIDALSEEEGINVLIYPSTDTRAIALNNNIPPFDNPTVRQAIAYAIPYEDIVNTVWAGYATQLKSPIPEGMPTSDFSLWPYETDPDHARELLAEAGFPDGFETTLFTRADNQDDQAIAVLVQEALREIGVTVNIESLTSGAYAARQFNDRDMPMHFFDFISYVNDPFYHFHWLLRCEQGTNYGNYCDPAVDALIDEGLAEGDPERRAEISREIQQIHLEASPWIYLVQPNSVTAVRSDIQGWAESPDRIANYWTLWRGEG